MKVSHFYVMNENFGDHVLGMGMKVLLKKYLNISKHHISSFNIHQEVFKTPNRVAELNKADLIVVGGGGLISGATGGVYFKIDKHLIPSITTPILFYSLGYNIFRNEKPSTKKQLTQLKYLKKKSIFFSLRRDGSKEKLGKLGFKTLESPDPALWVNNDFPRLIDEDYVIINVAGDVPSHRYKSEWHPQGITYATLHKNMKVVIKYLLSKGYIVLFALHRRDDLLARHYKISDRVYLWDWRNVLTNTQLGLSYYKHARYVLGMRGHSQIIPIGLNVPTISLGQQDKNLGLMTKLGLEYFNVEINSPTFTTEIKERIQMIEKGYNVIKRRYLQILNNEQKFVIRDFKRITKRI